MVENWSSVLTFIASFIKNTLLEKSWQEQAYEHKDITTL
jgi:hypothetical protein